MHSSLQRKPSVRMHAAVPRRHDTIAKADSVACGPSHLLHFVTQGRVVDTAAAAATRAMHDGQREAALRLGHAGVHGINFVEVCSRRIEEALYASRVYASRARAELVRCGYHHLPSRRQWSLWRTGLLHCEPRAHDRLQRDGTAERVVRRTIGCTAPAQVSARRRCLIEWLSLHRHRWLHPSAHKEVCIGDSWWCLSTSLMQSEPTSEAAFLRRRWRLVRRELGLYGRKERRPSCRRRHPTTTRRDPTPLNLQFRTGIKNARATSSG